MINVSVIIPTYNRLWCLPKAINSCRNTLCNTEIIVVDDGSTDGTWEWLQQQEGIVALRQENQGQTYAINHGVSVAKGQYLRFLDSDDFLSEGIIDMHYQKAVNTSAQLICSRVDLYDDETGVITKCPEITNWDNFLEVQLSSSYGSHFLGMLFSKELVSDIPRRPDFALREDRMFLLEVGTLFPAMAICVGCAGYWVKHQQQMQSNYWGLRSQVANWQHLQIYKRILPKLKAMGKLEDKYIKAAITVLWPLAHWIAKDNLHEAVAVYNWILELNPDFKIPGGGIVNTMHRSLGFKQAEQILKVRRFLKYGWN